MSIFSGIVNFLRKENIKSNLKVLKSQKAFSIFSLSLLIDSLVSIVGSIWILRWVPPDSMGIWQTILLIPTYGDILKLGIFSGLNREFPYCLGKGDQEKAYQLASTAQFFSLFIGGIGLIVFIVASFFRSGIITPEWQFGLFSVGLLWFSSVFTSYLQVMFRTNDEFKKLGYAQIVNSVLSIASLLLVSLWGYEGMLARAVILSLSMTLLLFLIRPVRVASNFKFSDFRQLLYTGIPIYGVSYLYSFSLGLDRVFLLNAGNATLVGFYAPVNMIIAIMMSIPSSMSSYMNPRMVFSLGKDNDAQKLWRPTLIIVGVSIAVTSLMALAGWMILPEIINAWFDKYIPSIIPIQITLVACIFLSFRVSSVSLVALKSWRYLYTYMVLFLIIRSIFLAVFSRMADPLIGVAVGSGLSFFVASFIPLTLVYRATHS